MSTPYRPAALSADDYARAERLLQQNVDKERVFGHQVAPQPVPGTDRFWYRVSTHEGAVFKLVDPVAGTVEAAFDHDLVAKALSAITGQEIEAGKLPLMGLDFFTPGSIGLRMLGTRLLLDLETNAITPDPHGGTAISDVSSPDGRYAAFCREHDLWVRDLQTGEERQLTTDGTSELPYATSPDGLAWSHELDRIGIRMPPPLKWSQDSSTIVTHRLDQAGIPTQDYVTSSPADGGRPTTRSKVYPMPGEEKIPTADLVVVDVASGTVTDTELTGLPAAYISPITSGHVFFADSRLFVIRYPRSLKEFELFEVDLPTGTARSIMRETGETPLDLAPLVGMSNVRVHGDTLLWWSQRGGWGHLYAYDVNTGEQRAQLTSGDWLVTNTIALDAEAGYVWFLGAGREGGDPYRQRLYRAPLAGGDVELIDDVDADHTVFTTDQRGFFIDTASTNKDFGRTVVRDRVGNVVLELEQADARAAEEAGFIYPERVQLTAADGETEIWATVFLPPDIEDGVVYPVVEDIYPGPQVHRGRAGLGGASMLAGIGYGECVALASLGFITVHIDGRGTPFRSKAFHDHAYTQIQRASDLDDHVAALQQLAERFPLDLDRVGIFGSSGGGYASTRAVLTQPETYKVAVSACGNHDQRIYWSMWGERYHGLVGEVEYEEQANASHTNNLVGKLLLIHGELDDNVSPSHTMRVVDKLVDADADFDMYLIPGAGHGFMGKTRFVIRKRWDYFVRHLMGTEPPKGYHLTEPPFDLSRMFG